MRKKQFANKLKELIISFLCKKSINLIIRSFLKPLVKFGFVPPRFTLFPVIGEISVLLPTGQRLFMEDNGRDLVANSLYYCGLKGYEYETIKIWMELAKKSEVIFDIGAYTGLYSLIAALTNNKARIFAFEPLEINHHYLKRNIEINNIDNIVPIQKVVSDKIGQVKVYIPFSLMLPSSSSIINKIPVENINEELSIDSVTIDSFIEERNIEKVDLVKIDVETAEPNVLKGMQEVIRSYHPVFIIEILPHKRVEQYLQDFFLSYNYSWYWLTDKGPRKRKILKGDVTYKFANYLFSKEPLTEFLHSSL